MLKFIISAALIVIVDSYPTSECKWRQNITDLDRVSLHRYEVLEDCLYYFLSTEADKKQEKANSLSLLPPITMPNENLYVHLHATTLTHLWMSEMMKTMTLSGYLSLSWKDNRLQWDKDEWKLEKLGVRSYGHVWVPDLRTEAPSRANSDYTSFANIEVAQSGNVTADMDFRAAANCKVDYRNFPEDDKHCCFQFKSYLFPTIIKIQMESSYVNVDKMDSNWHIANIKFEKKLDEHNSKSDLLHLCLNVKRKSTTLRIELTVPMAITAFLVLVSPLFGNLQHQLYVKLFVLLLQFSSFQYLVNKTPQVGFGDSVPKIYRFYEFTFALTILSLSINLVMVSLCRMERSLPPPHRLLLTASSINGRLCCSREAETSSNTTDKPSDNTAQWRQIYVMCNNVLSILLTFIYLIGMFVLVF